MCVLAAAVAASLPACCSRMKGILDVTPATWHTCVCQPMCACVCVSQSVCVCKCVNVQLSQESEFFNSYFFCTHKIRLFLCCHSTSNAHTLTPTYMSILPIVDYHTPSTNCGQLFLSVCFAPENTAKTAVDSQLAHSAAAWKEASKKNRTRLLTFVIYLDCYFCFSSCALIQLAKQCMNESLKSLLRPAEAVPSLDFNTRTPVGPGFAKCI